MADILVVDDDQSIATAFQHFLSFDGHECRVASSAPDAIALIDVRRPDVVIMDIKMPGMDGLEALQHMRARFPGLQVVMMTAYGTSQTSIDAIRDGAFDYLTKPLDLDHLREVIGKALAAKEIQREDVTDATGPPVDTASLVGQAPAMLDVYKMIGRLSTNSVPTLVVGERGTGKGLVVATIHFSSARRERPLTSVDCGVVKEGELSSLLFGEGAGTIELSQVERLPAPLQSMVASALAAARTRGGSAALKVRVVATTDRDLVDDVGGGTFSRELYDELAVITLRIPPLRERRGDIPHLVRHFVQRFNVELSRNIRGLDDQVMKALESHAWPGNVGELERVVKHACIVARGDVIAPDDIGTTLTDTRFPGRRDVDTALERAAVAALHERLMQRATGEASAFHDIVDAVESTLVKEALTITNGNQVKASEVLGVNRATLRKKAPQAQH